MLEIELGSRLVRTWSRIGGGREAGAQNIFKIHIPWETGRMLMPLIETRHSGGREDNELVLVALSLKNMCIILQMSNRNQKQFQREVGTRDLDLEAIGSV